MLFIFLIAYTVIYLLEVLCSHNIHQLHVYVLVSRKKKNLIVLIFFGFSVNLQLSFPLSHWFCLWLSSKTCLSLLKSHYSVTLHKVTLVGPGYKYTDTILKGQWFTVIPQQEDARFRNLIWGLCAPVQLGPPTSTEMHVGYRNSSLSSKVNLSVMICGYPHLNYLRWEIVSFLLSLLHLCDVQWVCKPWLELACFLEQ